MQLTDQVLDLLRVHAQAAGQAARVMSTWIGSMLEASAAFATSGAERNVAMAATLMSAKSPESAADLQRAFVRESLATASVMATRIADALRVRGQAMPRTCSAIDGSRDDVRRHVREDQGVRVSKAGPT